MSEQTAGDSSPKSGTEDPLARVSGEMTNREEMDVLDFLLGPTVALEYDLPVKVETPEGVRSLIVHFRQLDPSTMEAHDAEYRKGDGPFAKLDVPAFNAAVCADAIIWVGNEAGVKVEIRSERFRGGMPGGPALALQTRFKFQGGLLDGIVEEVKRVSGYSPDRIGTAQRAVVEAGKGSSS